MISGAAVLIGITVAALRDLPAGPVMVFSFAQSLCYTGWDIGSAELARPNIPV